MRSPVPSVGPPRARAGRAAANPPLTRASQTRSSTASGCGHHLGRRGSRGLPLRRRGPGAGLQLPLRGSTARRSGVAPLQEGWCVAPSGETTRFRVHDEQGASSDGLRVYAGLRAEPFFIDVQGLIESQKTGRLAFKEVGTNASASTF